MCLINPVWLDATRIALYHAMGGITPISTVDLHVRTGAGGYSNLSNFARPLWLVQVGTRGLFPCFNAKMRRGVGKFGRWRSVNEGAVAQVMMEAGAAKLAATTASAGKKTRLFGAPQTTGVRTSMTSTKAGYWSYDFEDGKGSDGAYVTCFNLCEVTSWIVWDFACLSTPTRE
jgi:hypothetical protein